MLRQRGQEHIPPLVARAGWFRRQQTPPRIELFPAILLQELRDQPPPSRLVSSGQQSTKPRQAQRPVHLATTAIIPVNDSSTPKNLFRRAN